MIPALTPIAIHTLRSSAALHLEPLGKYAQLTANLVSANGDLLNFDLTLRNISRRTIVLFKPQLMTTRIVTNAGEWSLFPKDCKVEYDQTKLVLKPGQTAVENYAFYSKEFKKSFPLRLRFAYHKPQDLVARAELQFKGLVWSQCFLFAKDGDGLKLIKTEQ